MNYTFQLQFNPAKVLQKIFPLSTFIPQEQIIEWQPKYVFLQ